MLAIFVLFVECLSSHEHLSAPFLTTLLKVANAMPDKWSCTKLAIALEIGEDAILKVQRSVFRDELAFDRVLMKWVQTKGSDATGRVLYNALLTIERADLAKRFDKELLGSQQKTGMLSECANEKC